MSQYYLGSQAQNFSPSYSNQGFSDEDIPTSVMKAVPPAPSPVEAGYESEDFPTSVMKAVPPAPSPVEPGYANDDFTPPMPNAVTSAPSRVADRYLNEGSSTSMFRAVPVTPIQDNFRVPFEESSVDYSSPKPSDLPLVEISAPMPSRRSGRTIAIAAVIVALLVVVAGLLVLMPRQSDVPPGVVVFQPDATATGR